MAHLRPSTPLALLLAVGTLLGLSACGPVTSTTSISKAERALERARVADAQERAPYEYMRAVHFLHKAREEWGYSDFEKSGAYATIALRSAERAVTKAKEDPWPGSPVPKDKQLKARQRKSRKVFPVKKADPYKVKPHKQNSKDDDILEDTSQ